jgi:dihydrofolate reductase
MACDSAGGVGYNGSLPWPKNPKELGYFKEFTTGKIVVMGSTTWKDPFMPSPLPNRTNVVLSNRPDEVYKYGEPDFILNGSPEEVVERFYNSKDNMVVIGGAKVLADFISCGLIDTIQLTMFDNKFECDTHINVTDLLYKFAVSSVIEEDSFKVMKLIKR